MTKLSNEVKFMRIVFIFILLGFVLSILALGFILSPSEKPVGGNLPYAVVECHDEIKKGLTEKPRFDIAFTYKGTRELVEGKKFQVTGKYTIGNETSRYGCIVNYEDGQYSTTAMVE